MSIKFGMRDAVHLVLLLAILAGLWLLLKQRDRHWELMQSIDDKLGRQSQDLGKIARALERGAVAMPSATNAAPGATFTSHDRLARAHAVPGFTLGDWVIDVFASTVGKLTPMLAGDVGASVVSGYVLESLADRDPDTLAWSPLVATRWDVSDDGLTIRFELNPAARFSDGEPLTSKDVVFSYDLIMNPRIDAPRQRVYYSMIESVVADGPHVVTFKLREPYFLGFNICAGLEVLPAHWYGQFTEDQINKSTGFLVGSGPYRLAEKPEDWKPGEGKIELVRNENFWGPEPALDRVVFRIIEDGNARLASFRNGEIDRLGLEAEQFVKLKDDAQLLDKAKLYRFASPAAGYRFIGWNQQRDGKPTPFADKRVRRAMTMLVNRQEIADVIEAKLATVASGPFHPLGDQRDPSIEPLPYDPAAAMALLKQAGYEDRDKDGVVESAEGKPLRFKLVYPSSSASYQQMAFYLRDAYASAGVVLEADPLEWTILQQRLDSREFDAITLGWGGSVESDLKQIYHSDSIEAGGDNFISYRSPELDRIIDQARSTVDEAERLKLWQAAHRILHEDQPYTYIINRDAVAFVNKRFENVIVTKLGLNSAQEWFVPESQQRYTNQ